MKKLKEAEEWRKNDGKGNCGAGQKELAQMEVARARQN